MRKYAISFKMEGVIFIDANDQEEAEDKFYDMDMNEQFNKGINRSEITEVGFL